MFRILRKRPKKDIAEVLNETLLEIEEGKITVDSALKAYPQYAAELKPMLMAAQALRRASRPSLSDEQIGMLRVGLTTQLMEPREQLAFEMDVKVEEYVRLPARPARPSGSQLERPWRIVLVSSNSGHKPLGIELHDDIIIGRPSEDVQVDLDLTEYDGEKLGVSRLHALLQPAKDSLYVYDLASTNGTSCNRVKLAPSKAHAVSSGDILSFAIVHFKLKVVQTPSKTK
jgi:hypothetical protein